MLIGSESNTSNHVLAHAAIPIPSFFYNSAGALPASKIKSLCRKRRLKMQNLGEATVELAMSLRRSSSWYHKPGRVPSEVKRQVIQMALTQINTKIGNQYGFEHPYFLSHTHRFNTSCLSWSPAQPRPRLRTLQLHGEHVADESSKTTISLEELRSVSDHSCKCEAIHLWDSH